MSSLAKLVANSRRLVAIIGPQNVRHYAAYWNKDWMPSKPPKNEDERRAAARKYGLIPEDYEPYPDDGTGYGDYPKLPIVSAESRDPFYAYDFDAQKRNYGEPLHVEADMYGEDRLDANKKPAVTDETYLFMFIAWISFMCVMIWIGEHIRFCVVKKMPKQFPHSKAEGETHYTFERVEQ